MIGEAGDLTERLFERGWYATVFRATSVVWEPLGGVFEELSTGLFYFLDIISGCVVSYVLNSDKVRFHLVFSTENLSFPQRLTPLKRLPKEKKMTDTVTSAAVLLDTPAVAQKLHVSTFYVVKHSTGGKKPIIPFVKLGHRTLRFKLSDVDEFIASRSKKG
jgi:predicted DNA-binding transcriptional regulator AlpA